MRKPVLHSVECTCGACAPSAHRRRKSDALRLCAAVCALVSILLLAVAARLQMDALGSWQ